MSATIKDLKGKYWFDSWQSRHGKHHSWDENCPLCGSTVTRRAITDLVYEFKICSCGDPSYDHLIEQLWHRACFGDAHRREPIDADEMWNVVAPTGSESAVREAVEVVAASTPDASPAFFSRLVAERVLGARVGPIANNESEFA